MVGARQVLDAVVDDPEAGVGEDVVDGDERRQRVPGVRPGRLQALPGNVARVAVAAVDRLAQQGDVEGGVEVADQDPGQAGPCRR